MVARWRTARERGGMSENPGGYAGEVSAKAAWEALSQSPAATLVDVRSTAEWVYVGVPVLAEIGKAPALIEWDAFPSGELVPDFVGRLRGGARQAAASMPTRRSTSSVVPATAAATRRSLQPLPATRVAYNVALGFEGRLGPDRHRGTAGSWKAEGLPWVQS